MRGAMALLALLAAPLAFGDDPPPTPEELVKIRAANAECLSCHSEAGLKKPPKEGMDLKKLRSHLVHLEILYLSFVPHTRKLNKAMIKGQLLELHLSSENKEEHMPELIRYLISRTIANDFYPEIEKRVHDLNGLFFKRRIKEVNLN